MCTWISCSSFAVPREQQQPGTPGKKPKHLKWPKNTTIQGEKKSSKFKNLNIFKKRKNTSDFQHRKGSSIVSTFRILGIPIMFLSHPCDDKPNAAPRS